MQLNIQVALLCMTLDTEWLLASGCIYKVYNRNMSQYFNMKFEWGMAASSNIVGTSMYGPNFHGFDQSRAPACPALLNTYVSLPAHFHTPQYNIHVEGWKWNSARPNV
jgi:hypothetical protein